MKVLFIITGSGDKFYCGNCFRDNLHASALRKAGHDVILMPLYLPLEHESFKVDTPIFFPATSFYLAHALFKKRPMPRWIERFLNSKPILKIAASFSGTTSAKGTEGITLSMIKGEDEDRVFNEMAGEMIDWIKNHERPDVIHLSNSLIIGIAKALKKELDIPIVCTLQDEEIWVDSLDEKYISDAWGSIARNTKYVDRFVTSSEFYKQVAFSKTPTIKEIDVVYPGLDIEKYASEYYPENPTIGFFYRMNQNNGLDILAEAFVKLKEQDSIKNLKLKVGGGHTSVDNSFLRKVKKILAPYDDDVIWNDIYYLEDHTDFYKDISVISVPLTFDEGIGLYICEAFAAGRPAVEPQKGSFSEIVKEGGVLYEGNNSASLADALEKILLDKELYKKCKDSALNLSNTRYNDNISAKTILDIYKKVVSNFNSIN